MLKKMGALLLAVGLLFSQGTQAQETTPQPWDVHTSYAKMEILTLHARGIITGYKDGTFKPEKPITRAEFATVLAKGIGLEEVPEAAERFTDVPEWAKGYVGALVDSGYANGISEDRFGSNLFITREQMTTMIVRTLELDHLIDQLEFEMGFQDEGQMASWAKPYIQFAQAMELVQGTGSRFLPKDQAQRQAVALLVYRLNQDPLEYLKRGYSVYIEASGVEMDGMTPMDDWGTIKIFETNGDISFLDTETGEIYSIDLFETMTEEWPNISDEDRRLFVMELVSHWSSTEEIQIKFGGVNAYDVVEKLNNFIQQNGAPDVPLYVLAGEIMGEHGYITFQE